MKRGRKKLRRNRGRHSKIDKKCPFLGGKPFFLLEAKKGKKNKKTKQTKKK